eukprot:90493-Ditylum_brightwellii.AAC.1
MPDNKLLQLQICFCPGETVQIMLQVGPKSDDSSRVFVAFTANDTPLRQMFIWVGEYYIHEKTRKMKYPSEAIGTISTSQSSLLLSIIDVWACATSMARRNLLSQQHLMVTPMRNGSPAQHWIQQ